MRHPFQCILHARDPTDVASEGFVVVACGPKLVSVSLASNELISEWPQTPQVGDGESDFKRVFAAQVSTFTRRPQHAEYPVGEVRPGAGDQ